MRKRFSPHDQQSRSRRSPRRRWGRIEALEPRQAPAGIPAITEFMALNSSTLADEDGDFSDWIEIQNIGDQALNLAGWRLTDDAAAPAKWIFPSTNLSVGQRLIVFASSKDRSGPDELHTNFNLSGDGEYLALISPAGDWTASEYAPYPPQFEDYSYGPGRETVGDPLLQTGDPVRALVPAGGSLGTSWTGAAANEPFNDSAWLTGPSGVGFDLAGPVSPPQQVAGHPLLNRPQQDGAVGSIFILESQRFTGPGLIGSWSAYSDAGGQMTPLLLRPNDFGEYEITAIGTTRLLTAGGVQSFAFDLQSGNASVDAEVVFGWKDGGNGSNNAGVADLTDNTADSVRYFGQHTNFFLGENLGIGTALNRTYSLSASATAAAALTPLAYWSFNGHVNDDSDNGFDGENRGAIVSSQIPIQLSTGQSLNFDGASDYVSVGIDVPETNYSSSMWFRTSTAGRGLFAVVDGDLGAGGHDRHLYLNGGNIAARTWNNEVISSTGRNYADGQWHFVVHVVGAAVGGQRIYVDGQQVASGTKSFSNFDWQKRVNIGFSNDGAGDYFQGEIDDVAIWPAALSTAQIQSLHQGASPLTLSGYRPWIGLDLTGTMTGRSSVYVRSSFATIDPNAFNSLELAVRYDDGFAAYLNGTEIARRNAPASLSFTSVASSNRPRADALRLETIDVSLPPGLLRAGTNVLAFHLLADSVNDTDLLLAPEVRGLRSLSDRYLEPTPGAGNSQGVQGFIAAPEISVPHGFYDQTFTTAIVSATAGATIYYTLDGSPPDPANPAAQLYGSPLTISGTTTLRAAAIKPDFEPSPIATASYLFLSNIVQQPALPAGYPSTWSGGSPADYGIDPDVTNNTLPGYSFNEAMLSLPTVSIVTDFDNLWSSSTGIYYNSNQRGSAWEREASIELIYPGGGEGLQIDAGIRMHGNSSRNHSFTPKHPIRLHFRGDYGATRLEHPLFADALYESFNQLLLRPSSTDSWPVTNGNFVQGVQRWHPLHATYIRDQWMRDTHNAMGWPSPHGTYVHLFLNGLYWGQYNIAERPTDDFQASNFGGVREDYDIIKDFAELQSGTKDAWNQLFALAGAGLASEAAYQRIQGNNQDGTPNEAYPVLLDVDSLMDYMILHIYGGAEDWPDHNYWAARRRGADSEGFRFFVWDQEISNDSLVREYTRISTRFENPIGGQNPSYLYGQLMQNATWRQNFIDRVHELLFNGGLLTPEQNQERWLVRQGEIDQSIVAESARWGDNRRAVPYTREVEWLNEMNWMRDQYWPQIHPIALARFQAVGLYPQVAAPTFSQHGGQWTFGNSLAITAPVGSIYYTLDGSDPRDPSALLYTGPLAIAGSMQVRARALVAGEWSALTSASFQVFEPASAANFTISEVNYHAHAPSAAELAAAPGLVEDDYDFVELRNIGAATIDLHGVEFTEGITFDFTGSGITTLAPGEFVVVVENAIAFAARYGTGVPVAGVFDGSLRNSDDHLILVDRFNAVIRDFSYFDSGDWPGRADGDGSSLEAIGPTGNFNAAANWRPSSEFGGSPGYAGIAGEGAVVINEVLSHTDLPLVDYIELYNTTSAPIDISHWGISDSTSNFDKFRIPAGTVLPAGGYLVFDEHDFNSGGGSLPRDFGLNAAEGETLTLLTGDAGGNLLRFVDTASFGAAANPEAWGRWPNAIGELYPMLSLTPGAANSGPRVGPVIISELMYHPVSESSGNAHLEYIEVLNPSQATVDLTHWSLSGISAFSFPEGFMLAPQQVIVIVPFNPTNPLDAAKLAGFRATYNVSTSTVLFGPYSGQLANSGERVALYRNDEPPAEDPLFYPQLLEDRLTYDDLAPWPTSADGSGDSLTRVSCSSWGEDSASWQAAAPTPGLAACAGVTGRQVFYDGSAFDSGGSTGDDQSRATDKVALRPGEMASAANYTSYVHGLNGLMFDLAGRASNDPLTAADVTVRRGTDDTPGDWPLAAAPSIVTRLGAGPGGADRIVLTWPAGTITNTWLEVTVQANPTTGLLAEDVFYFGNLIGDANGDAAVNATDFAAVRSNPATFLQPAAIDNHYDLNRDGRVNALDLLIVRDHPTGLGGGFAMITPAEQSLHLKASAQCRLLCSGTAQAVRYWVKQAASESKKPSQSLVEAAPTEEAIILNASDDEARTTALLLLVQDMQAEPAGIANALESIRSEEESLLRDSDSTT